MENNSARTSAPSNEPAQGMPTESGADQLPQATCLCHQTRQTSHTRPRKASHRSVPRLSGYETVHGCRGASSSCMLNIANIGLPLVSWLDGRFGPTWVPMGVPQQEDFPLRSQIFRQGRSKATIAWDILASCCTPLLNRPVKTVVVQLLRPAGVMKIFSSVGASRNSLCSVPTRLSHRLARLLLPARMAMLSLAPRQQVSNQRFRYLRLAAGTR